MDFQDEGSLQKALAGVDVLVYIASKTYTVLDRVKELENVLAAMQQAQVTKLVAMSFIADQEDNPFVMSPFYGYLPRRLAGTNLAYVILKNALYADPLGSLSARINSAQRPDLPSRTPSHPLLRWKTRRKLSLARLLPQLCSRAGQLTFWHKMTP